LTNGIDFYLGIKKYQRKEKKREEITNK
jgi:hypothetical protein